MIARCSSAAFGRVSPTGSQLKSSDQKTPSYTTSGDVSHNTASIRTAKRMVYALASSAHPQSETKISAHTIEKDMGSRCRPSIGVDRSHFKPCREFPVVQDTLFGFNS